MFGKKEKNFNYFRYFSDRADNICAAADYLHKSLNSYNKSTFTENINEMHKIENDADSAKHDMTKRLVHEFITPIEREDIYEFAQQLDDIVDSLDDVMRMIYMFNVSEIKSDALAFTDLIVKCSYEFKLAVKDFESFKSSKTIGERLVSVNSLEYEGDKLHADICHKLFASESDTKELLIWKSIYDDLEACLDFIEDAADTIESVIMKNT